MHELMEKRGIVMKYILFSPVGMTDPISHFHDGAMLHICRKYRPEKVLLYLSKEISEIHDKDDRYRHSISKLCELLGIHIQVELLINRNLTEVHRFDDFYNEFETILKRLEEENPGHQILVNVSSGTPAMKSALQTIAALNERNYLPIQVSTPEGKSNPAREHVDDFDALWELNEDNREDFVDRTSVSSYLNLNARIKKRIVCKHVDVYDYNAALSVANDIRQQICPEAIKLLEAAKCRLLLDIPGVQRALKDCHYDVFPIKQSDEIAVFEYLLWLQVKAERQEYADFIRGITPVVLDLFESILLAYCGIRIKDYCLAKERKGTVKYWLTREMLSKNETGAKMLAILDGEFSCYKDSVYTSAQLAPVLDEFLSDRGLAEKVRELRDIEEMSRNLAAHEIVSVTDSWLLKRCGKTADGIMSLIRSVAEKSGMKIKPSYWNSYREMNERIKTLVMLPVKEKS